MNPPLPITPEEDPVQVVDEWLKEATQKGIQRHPNSMTLATVNTSGQPSARVVLLKDLSVNKGYGVFYTHYGSKKGIDISSNSTVSAVMHWDQLGKQVRLEGEAVRSPAKESNEYFMTRPWHSQLNAWVSEQSKSLANPIDLVRRAKDKARDLKLPDPTDIAFNELDLNKSRIPRPPFWGGYRLWFAAIELWTEGAGRFHNRIRYERTLSPTDASTFQASDWKSGYLQP